MAYQNKINWSDPKKGSDVMSFSIDPFKSAVLDYNIEIEGELEDIINRHFRNPKAFKTRGMGFNIRLKLARALIGETPDDEIWGIVTNLNELRNKFAHSKSHQSVEGAEKIQEIVDKILEQLRKIWPEISLATVPENEKNLAIINQANLGVRRFFREIKTGLDSRCKADHS